MREKDERITNQAQFIQQIVGGQMFQLVGQDAPEEVPSNAVPKPGRIAAPGAGNRIEAIQPFLPNIQIEQYNQRIDRELAVVSGLNDLLLGVAPSSVLGRLWKDCLGCFVFYSGHCTSCIASPPIVLIASVPPFVFERNASL